MGQRWTEAELELLADVSVPLVEVARRTGRSISSVRSLASRRGHQRRELPWTEDELVVLRDKSLSYEAVAAQTGRTLATVRVRASIEGVARQAASQVWAPWELELLADPDLTLAEVMQFTGRSWPSVQLKASKSKFRRRAQNPLSGTGRKLYGRDWPEIRAQVLERDGYTCQEDGCGLFVPSGKGLHVHHVIPYRLRPSTDPAWLLTLCVSHHLRRPEHWWRSLPPDVEAQLQAG